MKCYACLIEVGAVKEMVGICKFCGVACCAGHFAEVARVTQGGAHYACNHSFPTPAQAASATVALNGAAAQYVAVCKHCGVALTPEAAAELAKHNQGGMRYGCSHTPPDRPSA